LVSEASTRIEKIPAKYETMTEQIETSPASTKWVKKKADRNCLSANPEDCLVWCLVEVPAQYRTITKKVRQACTAGYTQSGDDCVKTIDVPAQYGSRTYRKLVTPATTETVTVPAQYDTRSYQVLATPATSESVPVPAKYDTRSYQKLVTPATTESVQTPAQYTNRTYRKLAKGASYETVQVPAVYKSRSYQKLVTPATSQSVDVPARYESRSFQKLLSAATTETVTVPAQYGSRSYKKVASPATTESVEIPAQYGSRSYQKLTRDAAAEPLPCGSGGSVINVNFESGSSTLTQGSYAEINRIASTIDCSAGCSTTLTGHTDSQGSAEANQSLSTRRAKAVYDALVAAGVDSGCVRYEGRGESSPIADNSTASGRRQNRRTEMASSCGGGGNIDCNRYGSRSYQRLVSDATSESVDIAAAYGSRSYQKLVSDATTESTDIAATYGSRSYQKLSNDATTESNDIPASYGSRSYKKLVSPATTRTIDIPAEYKTVSKRRLVSEGGVTEWREVVCDTDVTPDLTRRVQAALQQMGYDPGPIDNSMGAKTREALVKFQKDKGLPVGQLDMETLKALGVRQ